MRLRLTAARELQLLDFGAPEFFVEGDAGGEGYGPLQMFAASLALCTASVLLSYDSNVLEVGTQGLSMTVKWTYGDKPSRVESLSMTILWPELPENRVDAAQRAAASCTIHHTLEQPPDVSTVVRRHRESS